jgi:hypothetical protein
MKIMSAYLRKILLTGICVATILLMVPAMPAIADNPVITLDGNFSDWEGHMYIADPIGDAAIHHRDIIAFYWANNPDDETCYWMLERVPASSTVRYILFLDMNNNGDFRENVDRLVQVVYNPQQNSSFVRMIVRYGDTGQRISSVYNQDWGESSTEGGRKVEFAVSFDDLGMGIGQTIRMYAIAYRVIPFQGFMDEMEIQDLLEFIQDLDLEELSEFLDDSQIQELSELLSNMEWEDLEEFLAGTELQELEELILCLIGTHIIDRVPDCGDIQWSPVSILGYPLLASVMIIGIVCIWYFKGRKRWNLP